jgi:hypothetical protein
MRKLRWLAICILPAIAALGCTPPPTGGRAPSEAGSARDAGDDLKLQALWKGTKVVVGIGEVHNLLAEESGMVKAAVDYKKAEIKKCFEEVVLKRGCRTNGIPAAFDAMLMIDTEGFIRETRIVPNKNDLPHECHDAVLCVQDVFATVQVQGLTRFQGRRQVYTTISLVTPDESTLGTADAAL